MCLHTVCAEARSGSKKESISLPQAQNHCVLSTDFRKDRHAGSKSAWDDESVRPLWQLKQECRKSGRRVQIAELLTLCGVKHFELDLSHHKYKGRVVFPPDQARDAAGKRVLFGSEEAAASPTGLVCFFYGLRHGHATAVPDAIQAYHQHPLGVKHG